MLDSYELSFDLKLQANLFLNSLTFALLQWLLFNVMHGSPYEMAGTQMKLNSKYVKGEGKQVPLSWKSGPPKARNQNTLKLSRHSWQYSF